MAAAADGKNLSSCDARNDLRELTSVITKIRLSLAMAAALAATMPVSAQNTPAPAERPVPGVMQRTEGGTVDPDGTIKMQVTAPLSDYLSPQAKAFLVDWLKVPMSFPGKTIEEVRANYDKNIWTHILASWRALYPVEITRGQIAGIPSSTITPAQGIDPANKHRIIINVHGGGFNTGGLLLGEVESVPLVGIGKVKVVSLDYRMAPEYHFPAASEDVAKVYRELLKTYKPQNIAIYGCSAGGALAAESIAWFQKEHLPKPGAVGVFCAGALPAVEHSDAKSVFNSGMIGGAWPVGGDNSGRPAQAQARYFAGVSADDPLAYPGNSPEVLAKFPPTFIVTGTRDMALSSAVTLNNRLLAQGVDTQLYVQEGLGHGFLILMPGVPEAVAAYDAVWRFFDRRLGR
jgi:monoterpene epsilon-lactone hydrolase